MFISDFERNAGFPGGTANFVTHVPAATGRSLTAAASVPPSASGWGPPKSNGWDTPTVSPSTVPSIPSSTSGWGSPAVAVSNPQADGWGTAPVLSKPNAWSTPAVSPSIAPSVPPSTSGWGAPAVSPSNHDSGWGAPDASSANSWGGAWESVQKATGSLEDLKASLPATQKMAKGKGKSKAMKVNTTADFFE